jgi:urea transporter
MTNINAGPREDYLEFDNNPEVRQSLMEEIRQSVRHLQRFRAPDGEGLLDSVLRGVGQVVFQNNPLTGLLILVAISVNSFLYAAVTFIGALVGTQTARLLKIEDRLVRDGLFGFNGALAALAVVAYTSKDVVHGSLPGLGVMAAAALAATFSTIIARAVAFVVRNDRFSGFNLPYCIAALLMLSALNQIGTGSTIPRTFGIGNGAAGLASYAPETWFYGVASGIGQIFLQDNWLTGLVIVAAIAVNSRISAGVAVAGASVAVAICALMGANEVLIRSGLPAYNAALTAIALGGLFVWLDRAGALYAVLGAVLTTCAWFGLSAILGAGGLPVLTLPFVIVTWLMLIAARGFPALRIVPVEHAVSAERTARLFATRPKPASRTDAEVAAES